MKGENMDFIINGFKERIKALRDRNKQIDTELEKDSTESKKAALTNEKEDNLNQIRKQRTEKYEYEQISESTEYMKKCYLYLKKLGIIKSQHQFSKEFLNKSQDYMSMVICESRKPAINAINNLLHNLNELYALYEEFDNREAINRNLYHLIDKGQRIITKRILSYL